MVRAKSRVLLLLLVGAGAARAAPAVETFTTVQLRFACAPGEAPVVELAASFETKVVVPRGCPAAGTALLLRLACDETHCLGVAQLPGAAEAKLEGPRARIVAVNLPQSAPITLTGFQLEALRTRKQSMTDSYLSLAKLSVRVATLEPRRETWFRVRPDEAFWLSFAPETDADPHALQLVVHRRSRAEVEIDGWLRSGEKVVREVLPVGGSAELSCRALSQPCKTNVTLAIAEQ